MKTTIQKPTLFNKLMKRILPRLLIGATYSNTAISGGFGVSTNQDRMVD